MLLYYTGACYYNIILLLIIYSNMFRPEEMFSLVRSLEFETVYVVAVPDYCVANDSSGFV